MSPRRRVAVVGAGISGLTAAYLLRRENDVVLFEAEDRLGGHAHTHDLDGVGVDSGFIVHNHRTYPSMLRLFEELGVETQPCEMSMSIRCDGCGLQYAGGRGLGGILAQPARLLDRRFRSMLLGVRRFHSRAAAFLAETPDTDLTTFGDWLATEGFDDYTVAHYAIPLVACVWSSGHEDALRYPARYLFTFLDHHGMLAVGGSPQWYTVTGGSAQYVEKLAAQLPDIRRAEPVLEVTRSPHVQVRTASGTVDFDAVVLATHADTALGILADPTPEEQQALSAFEYTTNTTVLHTHDAVLPTTPRARASWNYRTPGCETAFDAPAVTYWMNRLQHLPGDTPYLVTLNALDAVPEDARLATMNYTHPVFTPDAVAAQDMLRRSAAPTVFAGAHLGWGFHEDGCRSGVEAAERLGVSW